MALKCFKCGCTEYKVFDKNNQSYDHDYDYETFKYFVFGCDYVLIKNVNNNKMSMYESCFKSVINNINSLRELDKARRKKFGLGCR